MLDIFSNDAFSLTSLTATINEMDYKPMRLGELGLFQESGITTTTAVIESKNGILRLLPTSEAWAHRLLRRWAKSARSEVWVVPHIPHDSTILAHEVQNVPGVRQ